MKTIFLVAGLCACVVAPLFGQTNCSNPPSVSIAATATTICAGQSVTLSASGASTYSWTHNVVPFEPFTPVQTETYQVVGTNAQGCSDTASIQINVLPVPAVVANASSLSICLGASVVLTASGAQSYQWNEASIANASPFVPQSIGTNTFVVTGTGANGCTNTSQVVVQVRPVPAAPQLSTSTVATCQYAEVAPVQATVAQGGVLWYADEALTELVHTGFSLPVQTQSPGNQQYHAVNGYEGCAGSATTVSVDVSAGPAVDAGEDQQVLAGDRAYLNANVASELALQWTPAEALSDAQHPAPDFLATGNQAFVLTATDANGCTAHDTVQVSVDPNIRVGNLMTPNGDGNNDVWRIYPDAVRETCTVRIYDGFGRLLLETSDYQNNWDATFEGQKLPDGDYYYYLSCEGVTQKGTLTVIN